MAKIHEMSKDLWAFHCPGCGCGHAVTVNGKPFPTTGASWEWNGSVDEPTFNPSLLLSKDLPEQRCHSFVRLGKIQFLMDCHHALKGQTVEIPEWE